MSHKNTQPPAPQTSESKDDQRFMIAMALVAGAFFFLLLGFSLLAA